MKGSRNHFVSEVSLPSASNLKSTGKAKKKKDEEEKGSPEQTWASP